MMVMTTKVNMKKIVIALAAVAALILALVLLLKDKDTTEPTASLAVSSNDTRVKFLSDLGWEVVTSPKESSQVRIPKNPTEVYDRYNALQKSQGYDLSQYAGKTVMRYVYEIKNFPGATEPVFATILVYKNQIIGGDITSTAAKGVIQGFRKQEKPAAPSLEPSAAPSTAPAEETGPSESPAST